MTTPEFRVRPVIRHIVTRYTAFPPCKPGEGRSHSGYLETLGEFDSEEFAEQVAEAMRKAQIQQSGDNTQTASA